ncbi:MAG TPA: glycosyltransferase family 4 protein [Candidatus Moranbacteria bacterium]|nr:glycosyltransferase family 4 protein [Candidatus Moranbacteria bacterium]
MRVLFFNYEYPPLGGGAANATSYILHEFKHISDLKVDLVTSSIDNNFHLEKIGENIIIHKLPVGKNKKNLHYQSQKDLLVYSWKAYFYARKLVKKEKYDLSHSFFSVPCGFISWILKIQYKIPYIVSLRGADVPGYSERFSFWYWLYTPIIKMVWSGAKAVISNSQGLKELALKSSPKKEIGVIFNGININDFRPDGSRKPEDRFIITNGATRLTARKGTEYLIRAIFLLIKKYPQIRLKIIGDGSDSEDLKKLSCKLKLEKNIEFLGRVPHEDVQKYYQEASVFVLPSLNEGMSNAMLEALSSGLPILATDTGGTKELIREGENGFIIKMRDSADIAEKIEKLIEDKNLRQKMAQNSREMAKKLSWKNVADKYYQLYEKISKNIS